MFEFGEFFEFGSGRFGQLKVAPGNEADCPGSMDPGFTAVFLRAVSKS